MSMLKKDMKALRGKVIKRVDFPNDGRPATIEFEDGSILSLRGAITGSHNDRWSYIAPTLWQSLEEWKTRHKRTFRK